MHTDTERCDSARRDHLRISRSIIPSGRVTGFARWRTIPHSRVLGNMNFATIPASRRGAVLIIPESFGIGAFGFHARAVFICITVVLRWPSPGSGPVGQLSRRT